MHKFRRFTYLTLATILVSSALFFAFYIGWTISVKIWIKIVLSILILVGFLVVLLLTEAFTTRDNKYHTFIIGILSPIMHHRSKWIFHEELGYFFMSYQGDKAAINRQGFFSMKELFEISNTGKIDEMSATIKKELDKVYSEKIKEDKRKKEEKGKIKAVKDWDGFLEVKSRREHKIKEVLK